MYLLFTVLASYEDICGYISYFHITSSPSENAFISNSIFLLRTNIFHTVIENRLSPQHNFIFVPIAAGVDYHLSDRQTVNFPSFPRLVKSLGHVCTHSEDIERATAIDWNRR